jgi:hypothetical protein
MYDTYMTAYCMIGSPLCPDDGTGAFWLCQALTAWVEHLEGKDSIAEQRFRLLLRVMPNDLSCHWRDLRFYRDTIGPITHTRMYSKPQCDPLDELDVFWTLADPLFTRPGNDRMTEHFSRLVDLLISQQHRRVMMGAPFWNVENEEGDIDLEAFQASAAARSGLDRITHGVILRHGRPQMNGGCG